MCILRRWCAGVIQVVQAHLAAYVYRPLRQWGCSKLVAVLGTFVVSGVVHVYPYVVAGAPAPG